MLDEKQKSDQDQQATTYKEETPIQEQAKQIKKLEDELSKEKKAGRTELFIFLLAFIMLLDIFLFILMPSWKGPTAILILQLLLLVPVAKMMRADENSKGSV